MDRLLFKRMLPTPGSLFRSTPAVQSAIRAAPTTRALSTVPRVAKVSFWKGLIPKPLRRENRPDADGVAPKRSRLSGQWNPATFFGLIFLLIGSMSIQMIWLRKTFDAHTRTTEVRIGLLREVVEKLQNGEEVDVEKALGSGNPDKEAIWDEVLADIEKDAAIRNQKKQEKLKNTEPSASAANSNSTAKPTADAASTQAQSKGQTAYFF